MIRFLEESEGPRLGIEVSGKITDAEYERISERVKQVADAHERIQMLMRFNNEFTMMDPASFWEEVRLSLAHLDAVERLALVGPEHWAQGYRQGIEDHLPDLEMRTFNYAKTDQAWHWLQAR